MFSLRAVSEHIGDAIGGHFVTYRRPPILDSKLWVYCSDTDVRCVDWSTVQHANAYMLVYDRFKPAETINETNDVLSLL